MAMKKILSIVNDQHWYIIAAVIAIGLLVWIHGCQSEVRSMLDPTQKISRAELQLESDFLIGQIKRKLADLDKQDELKMVLLEQLTIFGTTGTFNPTGLLNAFVSIGAISFGLNRNQKVKKITAEKNNT